MSVKETWNRFWFTPQDASGLFVFRVLCCLLLLYSLFAYALTVSEWNTIDGRTSYTTMEMMSNFLNHYSFHAWATTKTVLLILIGAHALATIALMVGFQKKIMAWVVLTFTLSLMNYNPLVLFGFDEYLSLALMALLIHQGSFRKEDRSTTAAIAIRVFQVAFVFRYLGAGYFKTSEGWKNGDILWQVVTNDTFARFDLSGLHGYWSYFSIASNGTVLFELFFLPLILYKPTRRLTICIGLILHASIAFVLNLTEFGLLMMGAYILFVSPEIWQRSLAKIRTWRGLAWCR